MMIKHIGKQLWNERRHNVWLLLELMVVGLFLLVSVDLLWVLGKNYMEPVGFDVEDTYQLTLKRFRNGADGFVTKEELTETDDVALNRLAGSVGMYPDVEKVAFSLYSSPYSTGGWWTTLRRDSLHHISGQGRFITKEYLDVFRIRTHDGQSIQLPFADRSCFILSTTSLKQGGYVSAAAAIGDTLHWEDNVVGDIQLVDAVCSPLKTKPYSPFGSCYFVIPSKEEWNETIRQREGQYIEMWVRVRPGSAAHFERKFKEGMGDRLRSGQLYVASVCAVSVGVKQRVEEQLNQTIIPMLYVLTFVLLTAFLGVFGAFWLRTRQRRSEIGLRMAMGASRQTIAFSFLYEALLLMNLAMLPALLVYLNLLRADVLNTADLPFTGGRVFLVVTVSVSVMFMMVSAGISAPAHKASQLYPSSALRDE